MAALLWLIAGLLLVGAEALAGDLFLIMLGGGALAAAGVAVLAGEQYVVQALVFAVVSVGLLLGVRPALRRRMQQGELTTMNSDALVGTEATVLELTSAHDGRVKLSGEVWTARSWDGSEVFEPGRTVTVLEIDGATAVVWGGV